jgi:MFS family permease
MGLTFAIVSPLAGRVAHRLGPRTLITAGMAASAAGLVVFATASADTSIARLLAGMAIVGMALGFETGPLMAVAVAGLAADRSGLASGLVNVARIVGATLGVAILGSVFATHAGGAGAAAAPAFLIGMHRALAGATLAEAAGALIAWTSISAEALEATAAAPNTAAREHAGAVLHRRVDRA